MKIIVIIDKVASSQNGRNILTFSLRRKYGRVSFCKQLSFRNAYIVSAKLVQP